MTTAFRGRWLADPAGDVIDRVRHLHHAYGADGIEFHDNNFFAAEARVRQVAEGIESLGLRWWGEGRIDTMLAWSDRTWEAMARSGLAMVFYGAESADQETLDAMNKGGLEVRQTLELNHRAASYGVIPEFSFVMGNPTDPEGDIDRTLAMARRLKQENEDCEIILYLYSPVPMPDADGQVPRAPGFRISKRWMNG